MSEQYYGITETHSNACKPSRFIHVQPWIVENNSAFRYMPSKIFSVEHSLEGKCFVDWISETNTSELFNHRSESVTYGVPAPLPFGHLYPRIYRPIASRPDDYHPPQDTRALTHLDVQLELFSDSIKRILRHVEPIDAHLSVFGHEIRNLLLLACTEVEAQWKGIMKANGYSFQTDARGMDRASTSDYIKLLSVLRLGEYVSCLPYTPDLAPRAPFLGWDVSQPTQSLPWYSAYNAVKHDREAQFSQARLEHALDAVLACEILRKAQFYVNPIFDHISQPQWNGEDYYVVAYDEDEQKKELPWLSSLHAFSLRA